MKRDGTNESLWQKSIQQHENSETTVKEFDSIIVGAGITGLTTALELQKRGKKCLIVEQQTVGFGTTGGTTSHINNFLDSSYDELISTFGEEQAKTVADYGKKVYPYIKDNTQKLHISCELSDAHFFLFSAEEKQDSDLDKIFEAHQKVGVETKHAYQIPFPVKFSKAIEIFGQGQFNPIKYINGLAKEFQKNGGVLLTETTFEDYTSEKESVKVKTSAGEFTAENLILATHVPPGKNRFSALTAPYRSYVLALQLENPPKQQAQAADLYDPYHYFRYHKSGDEHYLIVGGFDHKTGQEEDTEKPFEDLEKYAQENFKYKKIAYRWSAQYYVPADGLPYIGAMPGEENVYISTGYNGNGMTWGTLAGFIIPDLIDKKENKLAEIVAPSRLNITGSAKSVITEGINSAVHFVKDKFSAEKIQELTEIENGEGKIVKYEDETLAVYRDEKGKVHALSPVCPHMGCNVAFNTAEKTWDCPCHGSRFSIDGELLTGPAVSGLEKK